MRKTLLMMMLLPAAYFFSGTLLAYHLDGLWHNDREDITIRIQSQDDGFRAKRIDQGVWYYYQPAGKNIYTDRQGNRYEVIRENEIIWRDARTNNRVNFRKVDDHDRNRSRIDGHDRDWKKGHASDRESFNGTWINRKTGQHLEIRSTGNGYQVRKEHEQWEKFTVRQDDLLRSRNGASIELINPNMIRLSKNRQRNIELYTRIDHEKRKYKEKEKAKKHGRCCK